VAKKDGEKMIFNRDLASCIALDFDGVLHHYTGWNDGVLGDPIDGALEAVHALVDSGEKVVIFSTREPEIIEEWLADYGFPLLEIVSVKPPAKVFLDDRAIRFDGRWTPLLIKQLVSFRTYWEEKEHSL